MPTLKGSPARASRARFVVTRKRSARGYSAIWPRCARRLMEARMLKMGRREYVQMLRLLETFGMDDLHAAVKKASMP